MSMQISNTSKETVEILIREAFHKVDKKMDYIYNESERYINTAKDFGLNELAQELENAKPA